jgi:serine/threonine-protein kinase HipA
MSDEQPSSSDQKLAVYFETQLVGTITSDDGFGMQFSYKDAWRNSKTSFPFSTSIPLDASSIENEVANNFFVNLLPEERVRIRTCKKLGISEGNHFELLKRIGGDCAGALTIVDEGAKPPTQQDEYELISETQLAAWSEGDQYAFAEVAGNDDVRLSLAGAQDKLPVKVVDGKQFYLPKGNSPSTQILKFASHFSHLPESETFTTMLGRAAGVETVDISLYQTSESRIAVIERYDRIANGETFTRIHQEDFCQALGVHPQRKYQQEGGPNLQDCVELIKNGCSLPIVELEKLIRWTMFNWLAYNADAHAKNISLLFVDGQTKLAPFYDLVCTNNYPQLSKRLAMSIGGEFMPGAVHPQHLEQFASELDMGSSNVNELAIETVDRLQASIRRSCSKFLSSFRSAASEP